ncbi:MAG: type II toxin-antitoxin system prevent-host-death family antitoxin [Clostridiales bacterium]|nr:type II toxin-antitoxin system prevent-host-death family antitoxin [Clostridiales bacterium]
MIVNSTEVQNNFGKYLELASRQEILITRNGTAVARLIGIKEREKSLSEQLRGIIPSDVDESAVKAERMGRH